MYMYKREYKSESIIFVNPPLNKIICGRSKKPVKVIVDEF